MKIISRTFELANGGKVRQLLNKTADSLSAAPAMKIAKREVPQITIKPHEPVQSTSSMRITKKDVTQVSGADILAEQNKAMIGQKISSSSKHPIVSKRSNANPLYSEFDRLMNNGPLNLEKAKEIERLFFENTGIKLYCPSNDVKGFSQSLERIVEAVNDGSFPKEIKHILIGHGYGSSLTPRGWCMSGPSVKNGKFIEIYDYINKLKLPKNEPVLVLCCEDGIKSVPNKPGIGMQVNLCLSDLGDFYRDRGVWMGPGKIVRSGENKICGHFTVINKDLGGGLVYYD